MSNDPLPIITIDTTSFDKTEDYAGILSSEQVDEWNVETENVLRKWSNKLVDLAEMHRMTGDLLGTVDGIFSVTFIALGVVTTSGIFTTLAYTIPSLTIFLGVATGTMSVMRLVENKYMFVKRAEAHHHAAEECRRAASSIEAQLSLEKKYRLPCRTFMYSSKVKYDKLIGGQDIPPVIKSRYEKRVRSSKV